MTGVERLDLGTLQLPAWHPRHDDVVATVYGYLVTHPDGPILVDTGARAGHPLIEELYSPEIRPIIGEINALGVDERSIVAVVNTHLHFDHCGHNHLFSDAPVWVQEAELEAAAQPGFTVPEWAEIDVARLRVAGDSEEIAPGVTLLATPGHTPGHQSVVIADEARTSVIVGQCCYTCAEFEQGSPAAADMHDESYIEVGLASLGRLRSIDVDEAYFSHDLTVFRSQVTG